MKTMDNNLFYDVIIIGGGPAGLLRKKFKMNKEKVKCAGTSLFHIIMALCGIINLGLVLAMFVFLFLVVRFPC